MVYWVQKIAPTWLIVYLNKGAQYVVLVSLILLAGCHPSVNRPVNQVTQLPYYNTPDFTPHFIQQSQDVPKEITHTIGNFKFTNQHGNSVTEHTVKGKIHVANFMFTTCPGICPRMTLQMKRVAEAFETDTNVVILSYSVTPWVDTPQVLLNYQHNQNITKTNWHFLTGDEREIYALARKSYFAEEGLGYTKDSAEFLHTEHFILVDKTLRIRGIYNGTLELEANQLISDIQTLKNEEGN
jgi:protein SCO1/2